MISAVPAAMMTVVVVTVDGVAAQSAYAAAEERTGQRIAFKGGGKSGTGHGSDGRGGQHTVFARAAGGKGEAEESDEKKRECAAHGCPPWRNGRALAHPSRLVRRRSIGMQFSFVFSAPPGRLVPRTLRRGTLEDRYTEAGTLCHVIKDFTLFRFFPNVAKN